MKDSNEYEKDAAKDIADINLERVFSCLSTMSNITNKVPAELNEINFEELYCEGVGYYKTASTKYTRSARSSMDWFTGTVMRRPFRLHDYQVRINNPPNHLPRRHLADRRGQAG